MRIGKAVLSRQKVVVAFKALAEGGKAVVGDVFIQIKRVEFAEMFGGDVDLVSQEGADGGIAFAHGETRHLFLGRRFIQQQATDKAGPESAGATEKTARLEIALHERAGLAGREVRVVGGRLAGQRDFNHRCAMAHADATDALDADRDPALGRAFAKGMKQLVAALGHAAGTEADADLGGAVGGKRPCFLGGLCAVRVGLTDQFEDFGGRFLSGRVSQRRVAHLHDGGQRATTEAGDLFDGELASRIGVCARRDVEVAAQGVLDMASAGHMTGRAAADADNVFARRLETEHVVKGGDARDGSRADVGQLHEALQFLRGQPAVMLLERLENRDQRLGFAADPGDCFLDKTGVNFGHASRLFGQLAGVRP